MCVMLQVTCDANNLTLGCKIFDESFPQVHVIMNSHNFNSFYAKRVLLCFHNLQINVVYTTSCYISNYIISAMHHLVCFLSIELLFCSIFFQPITSLKQSRGCPVICISGLNYYLRHLFFFQQRVKHFSFLPKNCL